MKPEFEKLFIAALPKLKQYINTKPINREDKEDLFQETCLKAAMSEDTFKEEAGGMVAWLRAIAKNTYLQRFRQPWECNVDPGDMDAMPADASFSPERRMLVSDFLDDINKLPPKQAKVLTAKAMGDCDKDIAASMNTSVMAVKMNAHYGRTIMREIHQDLYKELT